MTTKDAMHELCNYTTLGWGYMTLSQPEDFFLFLPTFTGVFDVGGGLTCICGVSAKFSSSRSVDGADTMPLTFFGAGEGATPLGRVDAPFIPFERTREGPLQEPAAAGKLCQPLINQRDGAHTNL